MKALTQLAWLKEDATGTATILLEEDGHNTILVYGGANMKLTADDAR